MSPLEQTIVIQGPLPTPMLGLLSMPPESEPSTGVIIVNGGAQYRAGAHRLFVQLARHLATQGHAVLRFDLPGQGDSPGQPVSFEATAPHIGAAIDALRQHLPQLTNMALLGLCDGASASLLYLHARPDPSITHLILLNPWVRSEVSLAKAQIKHYYLQRLLMPDFWKKLLMGGVGWSALRELAQKTIQARRKPAPNREQGFQDRMAQAWHNFDGSILLLLSESDQTAQEFKAHTGHATPWRLWDQHKGLTVEALPQADHTCSPLPAKIALTHSIGRWMRAEQKK